MEIKLTADKKLMDALERIATAIASASSSAILANAAAAPAVPATAENVSTTSAAAPTPVDKYVAEDSSQTMPTAHPTDALPWDEAPSREEIQRLAIIRIQGGKRDAVKALIAKYGASRVSEVAADKLSEFKAELEAL